MRTRRLLLVAVVTACVAAYAAETPEKLSYQNFVDDVQAGRVKSIEVSSGPGFRGIQVTALKDDREVAYVVDRPYRPSEDPIFVDFLKKNQVQYKFVEEDPIDRSLFPFIGIFGLLIYGVPVSMLVLLIIVMIRIRRVHDTLKSLDFFLKLEFAKTEERKRSAESAQDASPRHAEGEQ